MNTCEATKCCTPAVCRPARWGWNDWSDQNEE